MARVQQAGSPFGIVGGPGPLLLEFSDAGFEQRARLTEGLVRGAGLEPLRFGRTHEGHLCLLQHGQAARLGSLGARRAQGRATGDQGRQPRRRPGHGPSRGRAGAAEAV